MFHLTREVEPAVIIDASIETRRVVLRGPIAEPRAVLPPAPSVPRTEAVVEIGRADDSPSGRGR